MIYTILQGPGGLLISVWGGKPRTTAWSVTPIAPILAAVLADKATGPAMQSFTWLAQAFGWQWPGRWYGFATRFGWGRA